jgi:hypothetical protein
VRNRLDELDLPRRDRRSEPAAGERQQLAAQIVTRLRAGRQRHERLDDHLGHRIRLADHARVSDRRVLEQHALDLERTDQMPR